MSTDYRPELRTVYSMRGDTFFPAGAYTYMVSTDGGEAVAQDISQDTIRGMLRNSATLTGDPIAEFEITKTSASAGQFTAKLSASVTASLSGTYKGDIEIHDVSRDVVVTVDRFSVKFTTDATWS